MVPNATATRANNPITRSVYYMIPLRWHRSQLRKLGSEKSRAKSRYDRTISVGLKKGDSGKKCQIWVKLYRLELQKKVQPTQLKGWEK